MEMSKTRVLIREQRLEKFARILSGKYNITVKLSPAFHKVACCDTTTKVWISSTIDPNPIHNLLLQKASSLHEIGHILFTNGVMWRKMCVNHNFANILEDGRVEEAVSRMFPKARLYFIYLNKRQNPVVIKKKSDSSLDVESMLYELVFREAKRCVGIPQIPTSIKLQLKRKVGRENYNYIIKTTRSIINAKTEKEAAKLGYDLEMKLRELTKVQCNIATIQGDDKSMRSSGSSSRQMPKPTKDEIREQLEKLNEIEEKEIDNKIKAEEEDKLLKETLQQEPEIKQVNTDYEPKEDEIKDVTASEEMIDDFFRKPEVEDTDNISDYDTDDNTEDDDDDDSPITIEADESSIDDISSKIGDALDRLTEQAEDKISLDAEDELRNENDIIHSGDADSDFGAYETIDKDDLKPTGKYGVLLKPVDVSKLDPIARRISRQFRMIAQSGDGWIHNQTRGKLEMHRIHTVIDKNKRVRIFRKKDEVESVDLAVVILLDASGSMDSTRKFIATDTAYTVTRALELGNYKSEVIQFGVSRHSDKVFGVKSFNQKTQYARKRFKPVAEGYTPLLEALEGADRSITNQDAKRKVCFVITDGYPAKEGVKCDEYQDKCKKQINLMEKKGISVVGVLIKTGDERELFHQDRKIYCNNIYDLDKYITGVLKKVLIKLKNT